MKQKQFERNNHLISKLILLVLLTLSFICVTKGNSYADNSNESINNIKVYAIGEIPPQTAWHNKTITFTVDCNQFTNPDFSYEIKGEAEGTILLDSMSGLFNYSPSSQDKDAFVIDFYAISQSESISQSVNFYPVPDLPPEQKVFGLEAQTYPDPEDKDYIILNEILSETEEYFNHQMRLTRSITISGKTVVFQSGHPNGLYDYHENDDIKEMTIYAETLIVKNHMYLPQTDVKIIARELIFEDDGDEKSSINTTPRSIDIRPDQFEDGVNGLDAGNIEVYAESFYSASNFSPRFILKGGDGQPAGFGQDGEDGISMEYISSDGYEHMVYRWYRREEYCWYGFIIRVKGACVPARWEDKKIYGTESWPTSGYDAIMPGSPGNPGNGGMFTSNLRIDKKFVDLSGGNAGQKSPDAKGGKAGSPHNAVHFIQKRFWDDTKKTDVKVNPNAPLINGADAAAPEAESPTNISGSFEQIDNIFSWITPYSLKAILFHAKDAYLYGHQNKVIKILQEYNNLIASYQSSEHWKLLSTTTQLEIQQIQNEMQTIIHRIQCNQDYFGNPAGWTPMLSFEVTKDLYEKEVDHAIRSLYLSYWIGNIANDLESKTNALTGMKDKLKNEIIIAREEYGSVIELVPVLKHEAAEIAKEIDFRLIELQQLEQRLLEQAERNIEKKNKVPFWKQATSVLGSICKICPIGQPIIGSVGMGLSVISKFEDRPLEAIMDLNDLAGDFTESNIVDSVQDFQDDLASIDLNQIEEIGIEDYVKNLQDLADPIVKGIKDTGNMFKQTSAPRNKIEAEFQKIKAQSPEYNALVEKIRTLVTNKEIFANKLATTLQTLATLSDTINHNLLAIDSFNHDISEGNAAYDQRVVVYLKEMERRARERLLKYHYLMVKAYEYRMLEPYAGELNLNRLFDRFRIIAEQKDDYELSASDFDSLKAIYEEDISTIVQSIVEQMESNRPERSAPAFFKLSGEHITALNNGEPVIINLIEMGILPPTEENLRIAELKVKRVKAHAEGDNDAYGYIDIKIEHSGISKLSKDGEDYLFRHYNNQTKYPIVWEDRFDFPDGEIHHIGLSAASKSLLMSILEQLGKSTDNILMYSRPAVWADLIITTEFYSQEDYHIVIDEIDFELLYDFSDKPEDKKRLFVLPSEEYGLNPYVSINVSDMNGRQDGLGTFVRTFSSYEEITLEAPTAIGDFKFDSWADRYGNPIGNSGTELLLTMNEDKSIQPKYIRVDPDPNPSNCEPHYPLIWSGNPHHPMSIFVINADISDISLSDCDEIAVFDGDNCVGKASVSGEISIDQPLNIICSKDDGEGNGFTEGHPITFRIWDADQEKEIVISGAEFYDSEGNIISQPKFLANHDYGTKLISGQTIQLIDGWNIISSYAIPKNLDMMQLVQPLIQNNSLEKVIDETGQTILQFLGNWKSTISEFQPEKGYHVKVNQNTEIVIEGSKASIPMDIHLSAGWNIIGYPLSEPQSTQDIILPLIESNVLEKVIDEKGNSIIQFFGQWRDQVGSFYPGEGYMVKVKADSTIRYQNPTSRKRSIRYFDIASVSSGNFSMSCGYFKPVWNPDCSSINPFNRMQLWLVSIEGALVSSGDEIGIFDGPKCVGAATIVDAIDKSDPLVIINSKDDGSGNGFTEGQDIRIKYWDAEQDIEIEISTADIQFLDISSGQPISAPGFEANGDVVFELTIQNDNSGDEERDQTPPVITLNGDTPVLVQQGTSYQDAGAAATDNLDGDISHMIQKISNVNADNAGIYHVIYTVMDSSGNQAITKKRVVIVYDTTFKNFVPDGQVLDQNSLPVENVIVSSDMSSFTTMTNTEGYYSYTSLEQTGRLYFLRFSKPGYETIVKAFSGFETSEPIIIPLKNTYDVITGKCLSSSGPLDHVMVSLIDDIYPSTTLSDINGFYTLVVDPAAMPYSFVAQKKGYRNLFFDQYSSDVLTMEKMTKLIITRPESTEAHLISRQNNEVNIVVCAEPFFSGLKDEIDLIVPDDQSLNNTLQYDSGCYTITHRPYESFSIKIVADTSGDNRIDNFHDARKIHFEAIDPSDEISISKMTLIASEKSPLISWSHVASPHVIVEFPLDGFVGLHSPDVIDLTISEYSYSESSDKGNIISIDLLDEYGYQLGQFDRYRNALREVVITMPYQDYATKDQLLNGEVSIISALSVDALMAGNGTTIISPDQIIQVDDVLKTVTFCANHLSAFGLDKTQQNNSEPNNPEKPKNPKCFIGIIQDNGVFQNQIAIFGLLFMIYFIVFNRNHRPQKI